MWRKPVGFLCVLMGLGASSFSQTKRDSVTVAISAAYDSVSGIHRLLFGESYRKEWAVPVKLRVLHLATEKGGLTITEKGGGNQTKSLRLKDPSGREWVLRSVQKYPERGLPRKLRKSIIKDILQDQVVTSHPFAALTVPPLANALGVPHTNPEVVFLPDDPLLGQYRSEFANTPLLFEEREPITANGTDNTEKVLKKLQAKNDVSIDQAALLRARLLDLILGDWDRHDDQWRWIETEQDGKTVYKPFPRDRDKVFYTTSGLFPTYLSYQYEKENLQAFKKKIRSVNFYNYNNRYFDRYFLNALEEGVWKEQIAYVKAHLTDDLISAAVKRIPAEAYKLSGEKITKTLIGRKNNLEDIALEYYEDLSKYVDVTGSNEEENIQVDYLPDGVVALTIYNQKKDGSSGRIVYQRKFFPKDTKELRIYGLGGQDVFTTNGDNKSSIKIHLVGGDGADSFPIKKGVNKQRLFVYDRSDEPNTLPLKDQVRLKASTDTSVNTYDRENFKYEKFQPVLVLASNPDQGLSIGLGVVKEIQAFRKTPYAQRHLLYANYATQWKSVTIGYTGEFRKLFWKNDLVINAAFRTPNSVINFFGSGNETVFVNEGNKRLNYYRNRHNFTSADVRLRRTAGNNWSFNAGIGFQYYGSSATKNVDRFLSEYNLLRPDEKVFESHLHTGLVAAIDFNTHPKGILPSKGFHWKTQLTAMAEMDGTHSYQQVLSELSFYLPVMKDSSLVLAARVGGGSTAGDPLFYQQLFLGGVQNLRGFRVNRFAGHSAFYNTLELRAKLFDFAAFQIPGTFGVIGFHDMGRVWIPNETSDKWHRGIGGGIYIIPANLLLLQGTAGFSREGTQVYLSAGFSF